MGRPYTVYDVFTDSKLAGNPLAVIEDGAGLTGEQMQAIAREFNLSETVFMLPPENPAHTARIRIFTTARELPFAGHPTVGSAIAIAEARHGVGEANIDMMLMLEENAGTVRCAVRLTPGEAGFCEFDLPRLPQRYQLDVERENIAGALGLGPHEIGFENHEPSLWSAGVAFVLVPVHDIDAVGKAWCNAAMWAEIAPVIDDQPAYAFVYCADGVNHEASFHARMFAPHEGMPEDPATGAAVAALAGAIHECDELLDGHHTRIIEQGVEMGRPSLIHLHLDIEGGAIDQARIGGQAVKVMRGELDC